MVETRGGQGLGRKLADISRALASARAVRVGFLENATYPDGTPVAMIAIFQDFGTGTISARPFFRNMVAARSPEWGPAVADLLKANGYDASKALALAGEGIAGQLRQSIRDAAPPAYPPLAASTVERKGFDKLLVDTVHMLNSVDHEVMS